jgi:hypothetical protein
MKLRIISGKNAINSWILDGSLDKRYEIDTKTYTTESAIVTFVMG